MVSGPGFEPGFSDPKSDVLPLDDPEKVYGRRGETRTLNLLLIGQTR